MASDNLNSGHFGNTQFILHPQENFIYQYRNALKITLPFIDIVRFGVIVL